MKNIVVLLAVLVSFSFGQSLYKTVEDSTNSGITEGSQIPESERPKAFIIKHVKDVDMDKDGVVDTKDDCLDTPAGKVVNKDGCVKLIRLNVRFDFDKYDIKDEYKNEIDGAVSFLKKNSSYKAVIEGHTDWVGTNEYNYKLSELRAKKVALTIKKQGINVKRLITKGFGETVPVASNESEEGRAQNRRVDISFNK